MFYPCPEIRLSKLSGNYQDEYGNQIIGATEKMNFIITGCNNKIHLNGGDFKEGAKLSIFCIGSSNHITIEEKCVFAGINKIILRGDASNVIIGKKVHFAETVLESWGHLNFEVGDQTTFGIKTLFYTHPYSQIKIGHDCMFSFDVIVQTGDGHAIFDLHTKKNINSSKALADENGYLYKIDLKDHIWVGRNVMLLGGTGKGGTRIGDGCVIGARSLVKGFYPNNVVLAGIPAQIKKKDIAWARKNMSDNISDCGEYISFTNEILEDE